MNARLAVAAILLVGTPHSHIWAQATQSSILGSVTDSTGAAIPGATVTVENEGTAVERTMQTDEAGDFRIAGLEIGSYAVRVSATGFQSFEQTRIGLSSNQVKRVDVEMRVGEVSTTVTVEGGASVLETETVTLSNVKSGREFQQLPLSIFGRGWANVTNVTAGVQSTSGFEVNGARDTANNFTSDGVSVNDIISSRNTANGFSGEIESLAEVKIMTANNSAEHPQVAQFAAVTKSGTNDLHGSLYWGNFNSAFSARRWQDSDSPAFTNHNMFAVTNGGPVRIPGVYDGRNKTFYFFSYGGARYRVGSRQFVNVPTPEFRQGDFSSSSRPACRKSPASNSSIRSPAKLSPAIAFRKAASVPSRSHCRTFFTRTRTVQAAVSTAWNRTTPPIRAAPSIPMSTRYGSIGACRTKTICSFASG